MELNSIGNILVQVGNLLVAVGEALCDGASA